MSTSRPFANGASKATVHPSLASANTSARAFAVVSTSPPRSFLESPRRCLDGIRCGVVANLLDVIVKQCDLIRAPPGHRPAEQRRPFRVFQIGLSLDPRYLFLDVVVGQDGGNRAAGREPVHQGLHRINPRQRVLTNDVVGGHGRIVRERVAFRSRDGSASRRCPAESHGPGERAESPNESRVGISARAADRPPWRFRPPQPQIGSRLIRTSNSGDPGSGLRFWAMCCQPHCW
jgi:hypothetical protein